jgi:hypothetical protein
LIGEKETTNAAEAAKGSGAQQGVYFLVVAFFLAAGFLAAGFLSSATGLATLKKSSHWVTVPTADGIAGNFMVRSKNSKLS